MEYTLKEGDIFRAHTGASAHWGKSEYVNKGCGFSKEATLWIVEKGIHVVGTDAWSWDRPLCFQAKNYEETHDPSVI